jgi:hypothetical protein
MTEKYRYDVNNDCIVDGELDLAIDNMKHLLTDVDVKGTCYSRAKELDKRGYFGFIIWRKQHAFSITMPGSPLEYVRDLNRYPGMEERPIEIGIYDGESWYFWSSVVRMLQDEMQGKGYNPYIEELEFEVEKLKKEIESLKQPSENVVYLHHQTPEFAEEFDVNDWFIFTEDDPIIPEDYKEADELSIEELTAMIVEDWRDYWWDSFHLVHTAKEVIDGLRWTTLNRKNKVVMLHELYSFTSKLEVVNQPKEELLNQLSKIFITDWNQLSEEERHFLLSKNINIPNETE